MSSHSQSGEWPTFIPYWDMRVAAHGYIQWVHEDRPPSIPPDFMERILNADTEAIAHFRYIDERIKFEEKNPSESDMVDFMKVLTNER